nr:quinolinate synthase NadA [Ruminococcus sp.]
MNVASLQQEILKLKQEKDVCVLAHSYVAREICEIADFTGDSYKLSVDATKVSNKNILMCGVRFMAETCKILSPGKHVWLAQPFAGCEMADQMDREMISRVKKDYPDYTVVAYVNTTAEL